MENTIKRRRVQMGFTQTELAKRLHIDPSHMNRIERGIKTPSMSLALKIADTLDCSMDDIFLPNIMTYRSKEEQNETTVTS